MYEAQEMQWEITSRQMVLYSIERIPESTEKNLKLIDRADTEIWGNNFEGWWWDTSDATSH